MATTWNPTDKSANLSLDGTNLIATATANAQGVRTIDAFTTNQKVYAEFVPTVNAEDQRFGVANASQTLTSPLGNAGSAGFHYSGQFMCADSADNNEATPSWTTGQNVGIAIDSQNMMAWVRVNGGAWSGGGDPANNTGGKSIVITGALYLRLYINYDTEITTAKFASTDWVYSAPSGFTQLAPTPTTISTLVPDADSIDGSWTNELGGTTLYTSIDEATEGDADYIISSDRPVSDVCKISLSDPAAGVTSPFTVSYRFKKQGSETINLRVRLLEGTTPIASWTHTGISDTFSTLTQTLTGGEVASITDPTNLFIEFQAYV